MELLTIQETAALLKLSPVTIRRYVASGRLPAVKVGRAVRIRKEAVEGLLEPVLPPHLHDDPEDDLTVPEGTPTSEDDPLWELVGIGQSVDGPTDVARNKHRYLVGAYDHRDG